MELDTEAQALFFQLLNFLINMFQEGLNLRIDRYGNTYINKIKKYGNDLILTLHFLNIHQHKLYSLPVFVR